MKIKEIKPNKIVKAFSINDDYILEIVFVEEEQIFNVYIHNKQYGTKSFMFGLLLCHLNNSSFDNALEHACEISLNGVEDYIEIYQEDFED